MIALCCRAFGQETKGDTKASSDAPPAKSAPAADVQNPAELAAIRATEASFKKAFDAGDAKATAAHWTVDGEFADESGRRLQGRDAIEREFAAFFAANPGARITSRIERLRLINADAAVEEGTDVVEPAPAGAPGRSRYTAVHVKRDGKWLMWSVREAQFDTPSNYARLEAFEPIIGTWVTESNGVEFQAKSRWIADKNFIEQNFESRQGGVLLASGTQIIGWDPVDQRIASWVFSSDGGHAVGRWSRHEPGWMVESTGTMIDGTPTSAVNLITPLDENAVSWRSVNRTAGAFRFLDTDEVILRRKAAGSN
jgi:uncharacterized protein (TIGR02246 family)